MTDYIKKLDVMSYPIRLNNYDKKNGNKDFVLGIESVLEFVDNLPVEDVHPVVHCKKCIHQDDLLCPWIIRSGSAKNHLLYAREDNDFCSRGE